MPSASSAMYNTLAGHTGIQAVVGKKIYPDSVPQTDGDNEVKEPFLVFQIASNNKPLTLSGTVGIRRHRFQLTGYCETRKQAKDLYDAIEDLLHGKKHTSFGGLPVKASFIAPDSEGAVDEDEPPRPGEELGDRVVRLDIIWWV